MQITAAELKQHTKKGLKPIYLLSADDPLLLRLAREHIQARALELGFSNRKVLHVEAGFQWKSLHQALHNRDLFSEKTLIELQHPSAKFDEEAKSIITHYLEHPNPDTILVLLCDKLTAAQKKTLTVQAIDEAGVIVQIWPIAPRDFPRWIREKCEEDGLNVSPEAINLLAKYTEGNLLATAQAIEKLKLLFPSQKITENEMRTTTNDSARFSIFDLTNYALAGDLARVVRIIRGLREEGTEATLVLWALAREIRLLCEYSAKINRGESLQNVLRHEWANRKTLLTSALRRQKEDDFQKYLAKAREVDFMIKGISLGDVWDSLTELALLLSGARLSKQGSLVAL